ncbi:putative oocyte-secreted protein 1 homolog [Chionomys nivalis]|uniref:putative oocyte-secreted protein 1 homolog n=1 Tax=Chionomys nivalis TaxID=269649 RepID=UPI002592F485|nr:putative oocyte-secreted protein 1 homolog [Chionomys nivalis]
MKSFLGLRGLLLLLLVLTTGADDWSALRLQCTNHWFYLRIKATLFHNVFMEPDEVFLGSGCPVSTVWPNDVYDFTYRTYSCGIVNKVLYDVTLLQTKLMYIPKNPSNNRTEMRLSCVLHSRYPLFCEAESRGDFTGNPPEWEVDMTVRKNDKAAPAVPLNFSTSGQNTNQVSQEPQTSGTSRHQPAEASN